MDRIKQYFESKRLNASTLKNLDNPKWIKYKLDNPDAEEIEKRHFRIGAALDCLMTDPGSFNDEFVVLYQNRPSGKMGVFIDSLPLDLVEDSDKELYREAYEVAAYRTRLETIIDSLWKNDRYKDYYLSRKMSGNKSILTSDEMEEINNCKQCLFENPHTRKLWMNTEPHIKVLFQEPIYFSYKGVECKGMLDIIKIDFEEKIIQPIDLKTMARSLHSFPSSYLIFGYYLQAAMYDAALRSKEYAEIFKEKWGLDIEEFEIAPMQFVVAEKKGSNPSRFFSCTRNDIRCGYEGGISKMGKQYKGIVELIETYQWHLDNNYWALPKDLVATGSVDLDVFINDQDNTMDSASA